MAGLNLLKFFWNFPSVEIIILSVLITTNFSTEFSSHSIYKFPLFPTSSKGSTRLVVLKFSPFLGKKISPWFLSLDCTCTVVHWSKWHCDSLTKSSLILFPCRGQQAADCKPPRIQICWTSSSGLPVSFTSWWTVRIVEWRTPIVRSSVNTDLISYFERFVNIITFLIL